jgi:hypothetical protein
MEGAKKYCETYLHQFMRGIAIPPFKGQGDLLNESELKLHIQNAIKDNNYAVNFDGVSMIYTRLEEEFESDKLETVFCFRVCCCLPFWRKREYEKQVALRPWTLKISLRKSNVTPMPMLGRGPLSPLN